MNKTYFAPTTSEIRFTGQGNILLDVSGTPSAPPSDNPGTPTAPARKLYV